MMLESGETVLTSSGRLTNPFPKLKFGKRSTTQTLKLVDFWLMQNAYDEASFRNDKFNALGFGTNIKKPSKADKDGAEEYLFGELKNEN